MTFTRRSSLLLLVLPLLCIGLSAQRSRLHRVPQQYRTIQSAVDAARTGDTVLVDHGTYYENVRIEKNIVVGSRYLVDGDLAHRAKTIVDGSRARDKRRGSTITISGPCDTNCAVIGLTIQGGTGTVIAFPEPPPFDQWVCGGGIAVRQAGARIAHNLVKLNHVQPVAKVPKASSGGISAFDETGGRFLPPPVIIERNIVIENTVIGDWTEVGGISVGQAGVIRENVIMRNRAMARRRSPGGGVGVYFSGPYDVVVDRNYIVSNVAGIAGGILVGTPSNQRGRAIITNNIIAHNIAWEVGGASNVAEGSWAIFINNTIAGNRAGAGGSAINVPSNASATLVNNIIWGNGPHPISTWADARLINNLIQGGYPGHNNLSEDPLFVPGDTLFRLLPESPALGLGTASILVGGTDYPILTADFIGRSRPIPAGTTPDLGAIEHSLGESRSGTDVRKSWSGQQKHNLKLLLSVRQTSPTERSYDSLQVVQAGRMKVTATVNDTGEVDLTDREDTLTLSLPPGENLLEVEFKARGIDGERKLFGLMRLEGFELVTHRIPAGQHFGFRQYVDLAPREYHLEFGAADEVGFIDGSNRRSIRIIVPPFWYQRWWAYAVYGFIVLAAAGTMVRIRSRRLRLQQDLRIEHLEREKLAEVDRLKSQFFANISHELRTPLTLIQGPADELLTKAIDPTDRDRLSLIRRNSDRLLRLIDQLLQFTRVEAGAIPLEVAHQEVISILRRACDAFASRAVRKGLTFRFMATSPKCWGWVDAQKLEQIIENLVSNAVKFTPAGGRINVSARSDHGELTVVFEDTGTGIAGDALPHVFERFYRADKTHKVEGMGIGLSLTKELVELHRGRIRIDSQSDIGTTVTLKIPLEGYLNSEMDEAPSPSTPSERSTEEHAPTSASCGNDGNRPLILVVEDNDDARHFIGSRLRGPYDVELASSGREALGMAQDSVPDLVISDVMMPGIDGYDLCQSLKTDQRTSHIPVILLTALADRGDRLAGLEHGADEYLTKPFDGQELLLRIRNLLHRRDEIQKRHRLLVALAPTTDRSISLEDAFLQKVNASVMVHLADEEYGIEVLARDVALSRTQVYRKLKALTNLSPVEYIRRLRLLRAKELLANRSGTVSEIAYQTGFSNPSWFTKCYKGEFGGLPSKEGK